MSAVDIIMIINAVGRWVVALALILTIGQRWRR